MIKKWFCFQSPLLSGALILQEGKHRIKTWSYSDSHNTHWNISEWENWPASLCPLHTCANLLRKPAKVCMCTKNYKKFFKNTMHWKAWSLNSWVCDTSTVSENICVLTLPGTKKGFLVQISFSVLANKIKGDLGERLDWKTFQLSCGIICSVSLKPKFWIFSIFAFEVLRQKKMFTTSHLVLDATKKPQTLNNKATKKQTNPQKVHLKSFSNSKFLKNLWHSLTALEFLFCFF